MSENVAPAVARPGAPAAKAWLASSLVAAGILFSKVAGLIRDSVLAMYFGTSLYGDVVTAGLRMPNLLQNLLGEGTLSASFIPVYAHLLEEGKEEEAGRMAGAIFALLFVVAGLLSLAGFFFAPLMTSVMLPGFTGFKRQLTIDLARLIFPMTGILVLSAWALGILNSHRHFFVSYFAPVIWNVSIIGALVAFGGRVDLATLVIAFGWGALLGGLLQFLIQLPWVLKLERGLKIRWNTRLASVREAIRNAGPAIMGRGVVQLSGYVDFFLASLLATGALTFIRFSSAIYMLPIGLFGMSVAAAELPELSRQRSAGPEALRTRTNAGLRRIAFYIVPSFVAIVLLGDVMITALFQRGAFNPEDTILVYITLIGYATGLLASTGTRLLSNTFFALRDTATPARIAGARVATSAILGIALMLQFESVTIFGTRIGPGLFSGVNVNGRPLGALGLSLSAGVAAWIEWYLVRRSLRNRIGNVGAGAGPLVRMFAAALAGAAAGWGVRLVLPTLNGPLLALFVFAAFGAVYFGACAALGIEEIAGVKTRVQRLLKR